MSARDGVSPRDGVSGSFYEPLTPSLRLIFLVIVCTATQELGLLGVKFFLCYYSVIKKLLELGQLICHQIAR